MKATFAFLAAMLVLTSHAPGSLADSSSFQVRGLVDLVGNGDEDLLFLNRLNTRDGNFDAVRSRLFIDGGTDRTQAHVQLLMSESSVSSVRVFGAYVVHKVLDSEALYFEAGKIPLHDGTWGRRAYSHKNPLIGAPLAYYWKSTLPFREMPVDLDQLLSRRGSGQSGVAYSDEISGERGTPWTTTPVLYENCWNHGITAMGTMNSVEYALSATVGAPASPVAGRDTNDEIAVHAKIGFEPTSGLKLYGSFAQGAYLAGDVAPFLPQGQSVNDYKQRVWVGSVQWGMGYLVVNAEILFNHYQTPLRRQGLDSSSVYADAQYTVAPGWYVAARYDQLRFEEVESAGQVLSWDGNVRRLEAGVGHRVSRELLMKAVIQVTRLDATGEDHVVPAVQASLRF